MADHGQVEYATAQGNDLVEHEATYRNFVQLAFVGSIHVANFVIGLAIGATTGHWMISLAIFVFATIVAAHGLATGAKTPSIVMVILSLLALAFAASG
jgi:Bacterial aa3 type cytochrome c oxidase subunit IV